jgi:hypothetical protein
VVTVVNGRAHIETGELFRVARGAGPGSEDRVTVAGPKATYGGTAMTPQMAPPARCPPAARSDALYCDSAG